MSISKILWNIPCKNLILVWIYLHFIYTVWQWLSFDLQQESRKFIFAFRATAVAASSSSSVKKTNLKTHNSYQEFMNWANVAIVVVIFIFLVFFSVTALYFFGIFFSFHFFRIKYIFVVNLKNKLQAIHLQVLRHHLPAAQYRHWPIYFTVVIAVNQTDTGCWVLTTKAISNMFSDQPAKNGR